jgi:hypothetical protein
MKLSSLYSSLTLISIVAVSALPAIAKPIRGIYTPFASDVSLEIENNRFREGEDLGGGVKKWQPLSNLKEIKKGVVYYHPKWAPSGSYYCHRSLWTVKGGAYICTKNGVKPDKS